MQVSMLPVKSIYPMAPPYMPRLLSSSSSISWQARIFGAPDKVPAGRTASIASSASFPSRMTPLTVEPICITCEKRSMTRSFSTFTEPNALILPRSFLPRSTSMLCSASSFSSFNSSASRASSSSFVLPRGLVPARGKVWSIPSSSFTRVSGDAPATSTSVPEK